MSLIRFFLRWSWIIVIMAALGGVGGYFYLQYGPLPYQSTATLMLQPQADSSGTPEITANPERSVASAVALAGQASAPSVFEATSRALAGQMDIAASDIALLVRGGQILISPVGSSSFITISATDHDPNRAWLLADGYTRGFIQDLAVQTRLVSDQRQADLRAHIDVLQQQLASIPLQSTNPGVLDTFSAAHARVLQNMLDTQAKLQDAAQQDPPVIRYGTTTAPVVAVNDKRVLVAGVAVGGTLRVIVAYLAELVRQWRRRRWRLRPQRSATVTEAPEAAPARSASEYQGKGRPRWAGSAQA